MVSVRTCGSCDSPFTSLTAQARFCPSCAGSRAYDMRIRARLKRTTGRVYPPHCARCGRDTIAGHSYCLSCATIRRLELRNAHDREQRAKTAQTDYEAQNLRHR